MFVQCTLLRRQVRFKTVSHLENTDMLERLFSGCLRFNVSSSFLIDDLDGNELAEGESESRVCRVCGR